MTMAQAVLLSAAKAARQYLENRATGQGGLYDVITIGRDLTAAIADVEREERQRLEDRIDAVRQVTVPL